MPDNAFADLIPSGPEIEDAFADLVPSEIAFDAPKQPVTEPAPIAEAPRPVIPGGITPTPQRTTNAFADLTPDSAASRIWGAAKKGYAEVVGERTGLDPETREAAAERLGLQGGPIGPLSLINRPALTALDLGAAAFDMLGGVGEASILAFGQALRESGVRKTTANQVVRDLNGLMLSTAVVTGGAPISVTMAGTARQATGRTKLLKSDKAEPVQRTEDIIDEIPETPRQPVERAGNINLDRLDTTDDVKRTLTDIATEHDDFFGARREVISNAQLSDLADDLGMTSEQLMTRRKGQAFSAEEALSSRRLLVTSAEDLINLGKAAVGGSDEAVVAFQQGMARHIGIQEQVSGMTAEAGRALQQFKIQAAGDAARQRAISDIIETSGGRERLEDIASLIGELDDPAQVGKFIQQAQKAKTSDKILEVWINSLLSGPQTHAVNVLSNELTQLWTIPETVLAAGYGKLFRTAQPIHAAEAPVRLAGHISAMKDGARLAWRAFKTEEPTDAMTKIEARRQRAIGGRTGRAVRVFGRALLAGDEFFKHIAYRSDVAALTLRQGLNEGLRGKPLAERIARLRDDIPENIEEAARDFARDVTFTRPLGNIGQAVQKVARDHPTMRLIVPFIRTPSNIVKFALRRSLAAPILREVRNDLKGGGPARDMALARLSLGSVIMTAAASLAQEGYLTGNGPSDPGLRNGLYMTGWQPNSIKIGDQYYSYSRLEPAGMLLGVAASFGEIAGYMEKDEADDLAALIMASVTKNLTSKTYLRGVSEALEAIEDPDRYGERWVAQMAGTVVPTGVAQAARVVDPTLREAQGTIDKIKSRLPGYSKDLPPVRNLWGEPIVLSGGLGPDIVSPVYTSEDRHDDVSDEFVRLKLETGKPRRIVSGVELTSEEYDSYTQMAGRAAKQILDELVASPLYHTLPDEVQRDLFEDIIRDARNTARVELFANEMFVEKQLRATLSDDERRILDMQQGK